MKTKKLLYALNLDADGRILSATYETYAAPGMPIVEVLPDGDITDYKYIDGSYVYDPLTKPKPQQEEPSVEEDTLSMLVEHEERIIMLELGLTE
ncbi:Uncharacterised protein [uncultured Eubacterium sp.]|uniref:hypothetical protein n=1 Tax=Brotomerdimonas butyrica TaxID=2981721 RepID=UPI000822970D|nr:hypothetical protein [Brotomerdimonas butyrica]MCU6756444.1 hypothetical protein [Brotomerdimonas butyrica]SCH83914.1 Uncharacterised protein [uncultured Eubacterium sp.]